jgi:hypothetical protein
MAPKKKAAAKKTDKESEKPGSAGESVTTDAKPVKGAKDAGKKGKEAPKKEDPKAAAARKA